MENKDFEIMNAYHIEIISEESFHAIRGENTKSRKPSILNIPSNLNQIGYSFSHHNLYATFHNKYMKKLGNIKFCREDREGGGKTQRVSTGWDKFILLTDKNRRNNFPTNLVTYSNLVLSGLSKKMDEFDTVNMMLHTQIDLFCSVDDQGVGQSLIIIRAYYNLFMMNLVSILEYLNLLAVVQILLVESLPSGKSFKNNVLQVDKRFEKLTEYCKSNDLSLVLNFLETVVKERDFTNHKGNAALRVFNDDKNKKYLVLNNGFLVNYIDEIYVELELVLDTFFTKYLVGLE